MLLTDVYESVAGHRVAGERQFPSRLMNEAAGEGVLTVTHNARLKLKHTHKSNESLLKLHKGLMVEDGQGAADLLQVVLLQQRLDERLRPLRRRLGSVAQRSVRDEAETQRRRR